MKRRDRQTNSGLTIDILDLGAPLMHRITGWKDALSSNHPTGRTSPIHQLTQVQNNDHWPQTGKQIQCGMCSTKDKPGKDLNVQIAK
jgi:hypothetical protein